jgi:hypothetical protein
MHTRCKQLLDNQGPSRVVREILAFHRAKANEEEMEACASA